MVITFSNIKGSTGGGGATSGEISGITLWSDETTKAYIDNALSGVTDALSAYTKTEDFSTINGSAITSGGNIVIEATPYTAGANIDITDHVISVTGISAPTKVSELVNDAGYVNSGEVETQITDKGYITAYTETDPVFMASAASGISEQDISNWNNKLDSSDLEPYYTSAQTDNAINNAVSGKADSSAVTAQISEVKAQIEAEIPSKVSSLENDLNFVNSGDVKTQIESYNYINSGQAQTQIDNSISGKLNTDIFTAYTANTQTELNNKQDASGMTEYATTAFTENTYAKIGDIPTKTSDLTNDSGFITDAALLGYATEQYVDNSVSGKVDNSALTQYYTSAQTDTAIQNATNGLASEEWVESQGYLKEHQSLSAYSTTEQMNQAISSATAATTGWVESQGYLTEHQDISGKLDTNVFTTYTANTQTELNNKQDASGMTAYATTAFTESTYLKEHQSLSAYSTTEQVQTLINTAKQEVENEIPDVSNFVTSAQVNTQIESKGYITGYTETDPVFMASAASGITSQDITNWNSKLDSSALTPYYTSAQTDTAIDNATSGKQDTLVSGTNIKTINNQSLLGSGNIQIQGGSGGGSNIIEITQAEYDALTEYTEDAIYVITDSQAINMDNYVTTGALGNYYTSAETDTAISNAVSGKTDKVSVTASGSGYKFPKWNNQGCITGTSATAYQASQNINGSSRTLYSNSSSSLPTIYAPTSAGSAGQPLLSNGSGAPVWGAYKFQFISQSQYDALATKDSTTIYFIVNEN